MEQIKGLKPKSYTHNKNQLQNLQFIYDRRGTLRYVRTVIPVLDSLLAVGIYNYVMKVMYLIGASLLYRFVDGQDGDLGHEYEKYLQRSNQPTLLGAPVILGKRSR